MFYFLGDRNRYTGVLPNLPDVGSAVRDVQWKRLNAVGMRRRNNHQSFPCNFNGPENGKLLSLRCGGMICHQGEIALGPSNHRCHRVMIGQSWREAGSRNLSYDPLLEAGKYTNRGAVRNGNADSSLGYTPRHVSTSVLIELRNDVSCNQDEVVPCLGQSKRTAASVNQIAPQPSFELSDSLDEVGLGCVSFSADIVRFIVSDTHRKS